MKKEENIKVVIVEPDKPARIETIVNEISNLQEIVGGYVESIRDEGFDILINEEGKFLDLEPNFALYGGDYVVGTAIFTGVDYVAGEFKSLSDDQIKFITKVFERRVQNNG